MAYRHQIIELIKVKKEWFFLNKRIISHTKYGEIIFN